MMEPDEVTEAMSVSRQLRRDAVALTMAFDLDIEERAERIDRCLGAAADQLADVLRMVSRLSRGMRLA